MKLSEDHKDNLRQMIDSGHWESVIAFAQIILRRHENSVLTTTYDQSSRKLTIERAKLDGARSLTTALHNLKAELKEK